MYEKLTSDFKKELVDRRLDIIILLSYAAVFVVYIVTVFILMSIFNHWLVILLSLVVLIPLLLIIAYTIIFGIAKKQNRVCAKDYIHGKRVFKSFKDILKKDVQILIPLIKSQGINTRPKVQEAIGHYQMLLLRKSNNGFAIISVLSLAISVTGIILSAVQYQSYKDLIALIILLSTLIFYVAVISFFIKKIYRTIYHNLSEYALYERIEAALSEIWMKNLI